MQSNAARALVAILAVAAIVVGFVILGDDDDDSTDEPTTAEVATTAEAPEPKPDSKPASNQGGGSPPPEESAPTIVVKDGSPEGGVAELSFQKGDPVGFVVESDVAEEVHIHGYDIEQQIPAGGRTEFDFPAQIEGIFEVELHGTGTLIAELIVNP